MTENTFPTEFIELPSQGLVYPKSSPLSTGKIELKFPTAREEDILSSNSLIKNGTVIEKFMDSLIVDKKIKATELIGGDSDVVLISARVLAYGPKYETEISIPGEGKIKHVFNLTECEFKPLPDDVKYNNKNEFKFTLPQSKSVITFKLLTYGESELVEKRIKTITKKTGMSVSPTVTTRLKEAIIAIDGNADRSTVYSAIDNMLAIDSLELRKEIQRVTPILNTEYIIEVGGEDVTVTLPIALDFFWPNI
jgi:hypothetical protein